MESLYRKYRPQTFEDVVGQSHVVSTLERAVTEGRTSHAYLFCGPRGTGKTTMARILAKALMCERGAGQLPDGTCEECRLIAAGEHPDVYELDAASRTGVDNVREEIISRVDYAPVRGRYKVYIIDEVHMLTPAAFNALLKTLEEPPEHVVFVMCTTDPQKVLPTILSRVQRFDFRSIGADEMREHLASICEREGFSYEPEALELVVRHARGGMRDAISTLEQLSVFGSGSISADAARDLLGEVSDSRIATVSRALAARDVAALFGEVATLVDGGRDLLQFVRELMGHVRDVYVVGVAGPLPGVVHASQDELEELREEAQAYGGPDRLGRVLGVLGEAASEMRLAPNQRLALEVALTRASRPESDLTLESLAERVESLERALAQASSGAAATASAPAAPVAAPASAQPAHAQVPAPAASVAASATPAAQPGPLPRQTPAPAAPAPKASAPAPAPKGAASDRAPVARAGQAAPADTAPAAAAPKPAGTAVSDKDAGDLQRKWKALVDGLLKTNAPCGSLLLNASAQSDDGDTLTVALPVGSAFTRRMIERPDVRPVIDAAVAATFGARALVFCEGAAADSCAVAPKPHTSRTVPEGASRASSGAGVPAPGPKASVAGPQAADAERSATPVAPPPAGARASQGLRAEAHTKADKLTLPPSVAAAAGAAPVVPGPGVVPMPSQPPVPVSPAPAEEPPYDEVPYGDEDVYIPEDAEPVPAPPAHAVSSPKADGLKIPDFVRPPAAPAQDAPGAPASAAPAAPAPTATPAPDIDPTAPLVGKELTSLFTVVFGKTDAREVDPGDGPQRTS